jgi:Sulfotransferase family
MDEFVIRNFLKFSPAIVGLKSKKHLFVHIPKNGGMSIRDAPELQGRIVLANRRHLISKNYVRKLRNAQASPNRPVGYEHARLRDISHWVRRGSVPFAIVRNPWSRVVSRFKFAKQTRPDSSRDFSKTAFEAFLEERFVYGDKEFYWHRAVKGWYPQVDYLQDGSGETPVNILRLENLEEEATQYFKLKGSMDKKNVSRGPTAHYKDYYDDRTIQIVADWYKRDVEKFGFDFETPARKATLFSS